MSSFDDREKAFEAKYQHDEEIRFKVESRAAKLLGAWVAGEIGLSGAEAEAVAKDAVIADLDRPGHDDLYEALVAKAKERGVEISQHRLETHHAKTLEEAKSQIMAE